MEWLADNLWLVWMGLAFVLVAVEAATVDFTFIMLGGGALVGGVVAALGAPLTVQVIAAVIVAILLIGIVRPIMKRQFTNTAATRDIGSSALEGQAARVLETVTTTDGRVRLAGETWSARVPAGQPAVEVGEEVRVLTIDGATAVVTNQPVA
ncbi:MAG TPA: NfeD family protein [Candidatus Janibacter merdipullorum]|nr:NfeD family protein [Candidatus Janibacter merdipullorum]